jgi:hypothetical protein
MNQQIRQLAEQAGLISPQDDRENWQEYINDVEKFAESLIRKCADIADLADENKCEWIGGNILTHFGVKE